MLTSARRLVHLVMHSPSTFLSSHRKQSLKLAKKWLCKVSLFLRLNSSIFKYFFRAFASKYYKKMEASECEKRHTRHDFSKIQQAIECAIQDFDNASCAQDKKKAFRQYSNQFERLIEMENPGEAIDEFITNCVIKAKKMKKEIDNP